MILKAQNGTSEGYQAMKNLIKRQVINLFKLSKNRSQNPLSIIYSSIHSILLWNKMIPLLIPLLIYHKVKQNLEDYLDQIWIKKSAAHKNRKQLISWTTITNMNSGLEIWKFFLKKKILIYGLLNY